MAHALAMVDPHARPNQPTADPRLTAATVGDPAKSLLSRKSFEYNHSQSGTPLGLRISDCHSWNRSIVSNTARQDERVAQSKRTADRDGMVKALEKRFKEV
jgi:hypothetical protein